MNERLLNERLVLLQPVVESVNDLGEEDTVFVETRTVYAERVKQSGKRSEEVGEHFPDYRAEFNIRSAHPVQENWRVRHLGGHLYTVVAVVPYLKRGYKTLICERVNE